MNSLPWKYDFSFDNMTFPRKLFTDSVYDFTFDIIMNVAKKVTYLLQRYDLNMPS